MLFRRKNDKVRVQICSQTKSENVNKSLIKEKISSPSVPLEVLNDVTRYCVSVQTSSTDVNSEIKTSRKNSRHIKQSCCVHALQSGMTPVDRTNVSSDSQRISSKTSCKMSMVAETLVRNIGDEGHDLKPLKSVKVSCTAEPFRAHGETSETSSCRISDSESEVESGREEVLLR